MLGLGGVETPVGVRDPVSSVLLFENPQTQHVAEGSSDPQGPIGRAVVHQDDFETRIFLCCDAGQRSADVAFAVVRGHDDGEPGIRFSHGRRGH